jgi:hypothetical protein
MTRLGQGPVRLRVLTTAALLSSVAVLVTAVWAAERGTDGGDVTMGEVTRVGVVEGQSIPGYVETSRSELAALVAAPPLEAGSGTYALVTLSAYLAPDRLTPILKDVSVSEVFGRVPIPQTQTQIVRIPAMRIPADVIAGMQQVAERKDREVADYRDRAARLPVDADQELRGLYDTGAQVALQEATGYRSRCSCLYAAIVRAAPAVLDRIAVRPGVRAVDPAPEVRRLDRAVFTPPLPDQYDLVRPPADVGLPTPTAGVTGAPTPTRSVAPSTEPTDPPVVESPSASVSPPAPEPTADPPSTSPSTPVEPSPLASPVASELSNPDEQLLEPVDGAPVATR